MIKGKSSQVSAAKPKRAPSTAKSQKSNSKKSQKSPP